jgi:hypothetical protein
MAHEVARSIVIVLADYQLAEEKERSCCGCIIRLGRAYTNSPEYSFVFYPGLDIIKLTNNEVMMKGSTDVAVQMMSSRIMTSF